MKSKFFLALLASTVLGYFGGWIIFGVVFKDYYASQTSEFAKPIMRGEPMLWAILIGTLAWSALLTWVLQKTGSTSFGKGLMTSFFVSFLVMVLFDFNVYAFWDIYDLNFIIVDTLVGSFFWALIGGIASLILGYKKKNIPLATT